MYSYNLLQSFSRFSPAHRAVWCHIDSSLGLIEAGHVARAVPAAGDYILHPGQAISQRGWHYSPFTARWLQPNDESTTVSSNVWLFEIYDYMCISCDLHVYIQGSAHWLNRDRPLTGFPWAGGTERLTSGIDLWSEPFICELPSGEVVETRRSSSFFLELHVAWCGSFQCCGGPTQAYGHPRRWTRNHTSDATVPPPPR